MPNLKLTSNSFDSVIKRDAHNSFIHLNACCQRAKKALTEHCWPKCVVNDLLPQFNNIYEKLNDVLVQRIV